MASTHPNPHASCSGWLLLCLRKSRRTCAQQNAKINNPDFAMLLYAPYRSTLKVPPGCFLPKCSFNTFDERLSAILYTTVSVLCTTHKYQFALLLSSVASNTFQPVSSACQWLAAR